ncbi:MAG: hypothetical protein LBL55_11090 [Propionibacteriaceae bacterium]|nr:hypothetical protein [Propionibacteriaceae bacterium]
MALPSFDPTIPANAQIAGGDIAGALTTFWQSMKDYLSTWDQSLHADMRERAILAPDVDKPALLYQTWPKDGLWHDSDQSVQLHFEPGVWLLTASGYGRCTANAAYTARVSLWDDPLLNIVSQGTNNYQHAGERAADLACWLPCLATVPTAGLYRARMSVRVDAASASDVTFVSVAFNAIRLA